MVLKFNILGLFPLVLYRKQINVLQYCSAPRYERVCVSSSSDTHHRVSLSDPHTKLNTHNLCYVNNNNMKGGGEKDPL